MVKYRISVESNDVGALVGLNDAPIIADPIGKGLKVTLPVNEWLIPKFDNRFTALLLLSKEQEKQFEPNKAALITKLIQVKPGDATPGPQVVMTELRWPRQGIREAYPFPYQVPVSIDLPPVETRLWRLAQRFDVLTDADREAIYRLTERVLDAFRQQQVQTIHELMRFKLEDYCLAYNLNKDDIHNASLAQYERIVGQSHLKVKEVVRERMDFRLICDNRVVLVTQGPEMRAIVVDGDSLKFSQMLYVAKWDAKWRIVR